jgi:putative GTP pyrophosphokinase
MAKVSTEDLQLEYDRNIGIFHKCQEEIKKQILTLLESESIALGFPIQSRVKTYSSINEKLENGRFNLKKSLFELQDLVGFRIILLFLSDTHKVADIIEKSFSTVRIYNTAEKLNEKEFGYSSIHIVSKIPESWCEVPTLKDFKDVKFEIQIRTLSQHIWSEASNVLQYKNENDTPTPLKRTISRVSALLETVDLELERTLAERDKYKEELKQNSNVNQKLNVDLLKEIMENKLPDTFDDYPSYSKMLHVLTNLNVEDKDSLENIIDKNLKAVAELNALIAKKIFENFTKTGKFEAIIDNKRYISTHEDIDRLSRGIYYSRSHILRFCLDAEFSKQKIDAIIKEGRLKSIN